MSAPHPYLLSYPPASWHIRGGVNYRSLDRRPTSPRRAFEEWRALADAIEELGGVVAVMPPPAVEPPLTGLIYAANHGAWFPAHRTFLVASMFVAHRQAEPEHVARFAAESLGLAVARSPATWEGQADVATLADERFILTYGVRTVAAASEPVTALLPPGADVLRVELRDPFFHGDTCISALRRGAGGLLLAFEGALVGTSLGALEKLAGPDYELVPVSEADALAYACNGLGVGDTVLMPEGVSDALCARVERSGFRVRPMSFAELFGKGGGGPRCLVNELRGLEPGSIPASARYGGLRAALVAAGAAYPAE